MERNRTNAKKSNEFTYKNNKFNHNKSQQQSHNKRNVGLFGSWAKNSPSFSKPSIWQCAWGEENHYQNKKCD